VGGKEWVETMRRASLLLAMMVMALVVGSGVALAAVKFREFNFSKALG
jgi:hypothetical protein